MRVVNTDARYNLAKTPEKCLQEAERPKKKIYLEAYLQEHRHFSPLVASADGILDVYAAATLKKIASCLTTKWQKTSSMTCGYVKIRISITLLRAKHRCIQGSRLPENRISVQQPQWEDGTRLNLFQ